MSMVRRSGRRRFGPGAAAVAVASSFVATALAASVVAESVPSVGIADCYSGESGQQVRTREYLSDYWPAMMMKMMRDVIDLME